MTRKLQMTGGPASGKNFIAKAMQNTIALAQKKGYKIIIK